MAASSLARWALGAAVLGAAAAAECSLGDDTCAAAAKPTLSRDSILLQLNHNGTGKVVKRHEDANDWGFPTTGQVAASGKWCAVPTPPGDWNMKRCPFDAAIAGAQVKVLTYNLYWWNLFDKNGGAGRSAGKLIAQSAGADGYDLMGFQECDDRMRVLSDARLEGLQGDWDTFDGGHALALMYRKDRFELLANGAEEVGEDNRAWCVWNWCGKRSAVWVRLRHLTGKFTVFYINHHGPLPVSGDGDCTGVVAAYNLERVIAKNAQKDDLIVLHGDFNAQPTSSRIQELSKRLHRVYTGTSFEGVDSFFSNCKNHVDTKNLGKGLGAFTSDHDALSATFHV